MVDFTQAPQEELHEFRDTTARIYAWICIALLIVFIIWASFSKLDIVSVTVGQIVPASQVKQIQHLEGGIVGDILTVEGQVVS